ncbi:RagB/SusD family nutrient uptake outer membrane protein [Parabacteroides sp. W1-Q-101]|uniref:RagB/SusD family nutrient uptake outer membrane protein n=1 Tax=Parabacteroides caeci TaxID=2949650 RepID=UPI00202DEBF1|nr:RagB/SusD family nutrient uptake outer membrane protein [Parabacteroides sp. W1-Q-101]MCM0718762.1 RagB/SusD family nutrient uptake outer membrane protein [Parabacteroides sp. W1-Q-101]
MMKNILLKSLLFCIVLLECISCNYLDIVPDNMATIDYAFRNRTACEKYLYTCYSYRPRHGDFQWDPAIAATDEVWCHSYINTAGRYIARGMQKVNNPYMNFWSGAKSGGSFVIPALWDGIRDCNIFLENVDKVTDLPSYERDRWIAEVKFLKAYYHFYLFRMYGPIPIMDVNLPVSATPEEVKVYREPVDNVVDYIVNLLDEAAAGLPSNDDLVEGTEAGRVYNLVAKAMKARVLAYAASPLFNGNTDYASLVDNRGVQLFPQTYDPEKWKKAADACLEAIDMAHAQNKRLYTSVDPLLSTQNDTFKLQTTLRQAICDRWNCELIWGSTNNDQYSFVQRCQSRVLRVGAEMGTVVRTEWAPTLNTVEKFYSSHGVPINEDRDWVQNNWYSQRYEIRPEVSSGAEKYYVKEGQKTVNLHYNREPRFYANIGFDRGIYFGNGYNKFPDNVKHCEFCAKEYSGVASASEAFSVTGYGAKKMHSFKDAMTANDYSIEYYPFPIMRMADLYLLYAEALNEYSGPSGEVYKYVDMIRERAGLEGVQTSWAKYSISPSKVSTKEGLREIIQHEREIELVFEGQHFWDLRRWKKIQDFNEQPKGWNVILGDTQDLFYTVTSVAQTPVEFSVRDYFWPINEKEISINPNLVQNFDW